MAKRTKILIVFSLIFGYSLAVLGIGCVSAGFAELYSSTISAFLRSILGYATCYIPFSVAEVLIITVPLALVIIVIRANVRLKKTSDVNVLKNLVAGLFCTVLLLFSVFINTFGICYRRFPAEEKFGLDVSSIVDDDVIRAAHNLCNDINENIESSCFQTNGSSKLPYDFNTLSKKIRDGYKVIFENVPIKLSVKPVLLSEPWTYTHISGMYMPFTGESNLNVNYPDYVIAFSAAHEVAHQLGIASENDANFYAYLACMSSGDRYLKYAASLTIFEYFLSAMDLETAREVTSVLDGYAKNEIAAYSRFFEKYRANTAAKVSSKVNDAYLKIQGQQQGEKSYGEVVTLVAAYMNVYNY